MNLRQILTIVFLFCCLTVFGQQPNKITLQGVNRQVHVVQDSLDNLNRKIIGLEYTNDNLLHQLERMDREVALYREDVRAKVSEMYSSLDHWLTILTIIIGILGVGLPIFINWQNDKSIKSKVSSLEEQLGTTKADAESVKQSLSEVTELKNEVTKIKQEIDKSKETAKRAAKRAEANKWFAQALTASSEKDYSRAIDLYTKVIELFPDNTDAYNNRGGFELQN